MSLSCNIKNRIYIQKEKNNKYKSLLSWMGAVWSSQVGNDQRVGALWEL